MFGKKKPKPKKMDGREYNQWTLYQRTKFKPKRHMRRVSGRIR